MNRLLTPLRALLLVSIVGGCSSLDDGGDTPRAGGFLDDFSRDSLRYTVDRREDSRVQRDYRVEQDRIVVSAASTDTERQQAYIDPWGRSDSITARLTVSSETELPEGDDASAVVRITGVFYNDTQDRGFDGITGDIGANIQLALHGDGQRETFFCVGRDGPEGTPQPTFIDGAECGDFAGFTHELDTEYTLSIRLDREAATMTFSIDDMSRTFDVGGAVFLPANDRRRVQVTHQGTSGKAVATVHAIGTDDYFDDFAESPPVIGPYSPFFALENGDGRELDVVEERARFAVPSTPEADRQLTLEYLGETDRIQSVLELSSLSVLAGGQATSDNRVRIRLGSVVYNDLADGGTGGSEGNVFASISLLSDPGEDVVLEYCAFRANDADFSDVVELVGQDGDTCGRFGIDAEYDVPYAVSIDVDRATGTLLFGADGVERRYDIPTDAFAPPPDRFTSVQVQAEGGSTAIAFADDFGTSRDAPRVSVP